MRFAFADYQQPIFWFVTVRHGEGFDQARDILELHKPTHEKKCDFVLRKQQAMT